MSIDIIIIKKNGKIKKKIYPSKKIKNYSSLLLHEIKKSYNIQLNDKYFTRWLQSYYCYNGFEAILKDRIKYSIKHSYIIIG